MLSRHFLTFVFILCFLTHCHVWASWAWASNPPGNWSEGGPGDYDNTRDPNGSQDLRGRQISGKEYILGILVLYDVLNRGGRP